MKLAFRLSLLIITFVCLCAVSAFAQTPTPTPTGSPTPDPFVAQITSSSKDSFVRDISGNGRFVVIESTGDLATLKPNEVASGVKAVNNADGNREIFLFDYVQRRIFQITNTKSALVDTTKSSTDQSNIAVEVSNNRPYISRDGKWIVFSSNAPTPFNFDGTTADNKTALQADGNQEIFLYRIPDVPDADLSSGTDVPFADLRQDAFTRVTNTPASRLPQAGTATTAPFVADDNRDATINDRGTRIAFTSTRNLTTINGKTNVDGNPEIFVYNRLSAQTTQITDTTGAFTFSDNPSISGDTSTDSADATESPTSVIAFVSNANLFDIGATAGNNADKNAEVYYAVYNGTTATTIKQVTRTQNTTANSAVLNTLSPGRRISRDGNLIAFETLANDPSANNTDNNANGDTVYVYNIAANTFTQVGPRPSSTSELEVVLRFPTFSGDNTSLVFVSALNIKPDGTRVDANDATGLNPNRLAQIFAYRLNAPAGTSAYTRLTNTPTGSGFASPQAVVSNTIQRLAFSFTGIEFGTGNTDLGTEAYYLLTPNATGAIDVPAATSALAFFTGASQRPVIATASPTPTPAASPTPTPVTALAPGMLAIVRTTTAGVALAPSTRQICPQANVPCSAGSESQRRPSLPIELNGVSLSIKGAVAGLYFVSQNEIQFVVPVGLAATTGANTYPVVININNGGTVTTVRSAIQINTAQPDLFSTTNGPGGRAMIFNVTTGTPMAEPPEGFSVTTDVPNADGTTTAQPTILRIILTGVHNVTATSAVTVALGDKTLSGTDIVAVMPTSTPGIDQIDIKLRSDLAGLGDVPVIVTANTFTSRPADTAPHIRIR